MKDIIKPVAPDLDASPKKNRFLWFAILLRSPEKTTGWVSPTVAGGKKSSTAMLSIMEEAAMATWEALKPYLLLPTAGFILWH